MFTHIVADGVFFSFLHHVSPCSCSCASPHTNSVLQVALRPAALPKDAPSNFKGRLVSLECLSSLLQQLRELRVLPAT